MHALGAWRESPLFSERERTALAVTEAVTRIGDAGLPDDLYERAGPRSAPTGWRSW